MQHCPNCGMSSDLTLCPRCGTSLSLLPSQTISNPTDETIADTPDALQKTVLTPYNSAAAPMSQTPPMIATDNANRPMSSYSALPYSSPPQPYRSPSYPANTPNTPPLSALPNQGQSRPFVANSLNAAGSAVHPNRKPEFSKPALASLLALLGLIMLSGFGLIFYASVTRPAQFRARATATTQAIQTANAQSTATVNAQVTAIANATATAQAHTQATATALQNIYTQATSGTPALASSLAFQTGSNWDIYDAVGGGGCGFAGASLHASVLQKSYYVPCFAHATNFGNFALEVQMNIVKGDEGGLIFRANDVTNQFYLFRVGHDGTYSLLVTRDNQHNTPILDDKSATIKTGFGQINLLTVIAQGNAISLYINKQFVGSTTDGSYARGEIGIFAGNGGHPTDVAFSNIRVWTL